MSRHPIPRCRPDRRPASPSSRRQDDIKQFLAKFGRAGVPFYIIFPAANPAEPIILPEYLPESALLGGLEAARAVRPS
jgi:thiol:disulfide interchange protein